MKYPISGKNLTKSGPPFSNRLALEILIPPTTPPTRATVRGLNVIKARLYLASAVS